MTDLPHEVAGEKLLLLPERAAYWVAARTVLVADPHFGKAAAFRAAGLPVPRGTTSGNLRRLDSILERVPVRRILFLGDLLHAREGRAARTLGTLEKWRQDRPDLDLTLVRGNHDRQAGDPPPELRIQCVDEPLIENGLAFGHYPRPLAGAYLIGGHIHPAVRLIGRGRQRKQLPCFWFGSRAAVLPSFGDFTGSGLIESAPDDRIFVVAGDEVVEVA